MSTQNTILKVLAEKILSKDDLMKVGIESKKAEIIATNVIWGSDTQTSLDEFTALINSNRTSNDSIETAKISQILEDLLAIRDTILDNPSIDIDSIKEANEKLDAEKDNFDKALSESVKELAASRDEFRDRAGLSEEFELDPNEDYSLAGTDSEAPSVPAMVRVEVLQRTTPLSFFQNLNKDSFTNRVYNYSELDGLSVSQTPLYIKTASTPSSIEDLRTTLGIEGESSNILLEMDFAPLLDKVKAVEEAIANGTSESEAISAEFTNGPGEPYYYHGQRFDVETKANLDQRIADMMLNQTFLEVKLCEIIEEGGSINLDHQGNAIGEPLEYNATISNNDWRLTLSSDPDHAPNAAMAPTRGFKIVGEISEEEEGPKSIFSLVQFNSEYIHDGRFAIGEEWAKTIATGQMDDMLVDVTLPINQLPDLERTFTSGNAFVDSFIEERGIKNDLDSDSYNSAKHDLLVNGYFYDAEGSNEFLNGIFLNDQFEIGRWIKDINFGNFQEQNPFLWGIMNLGFTFGALNMNEYYQNFQIYNAYKSTEITGLAQTFGYYNNQMILGQDTELDYYDMFYDLLWSNFDTDGSVMLNQFSSWEFQNVDMLQDFTLTNKNGAWTVGITQNAFLKAWRHKMFNHYILSFNKRFLKHRVGNLIPITDAIKSVELVNHSDSSNAAYADVKFTFDKAIIDDAYGKGQIYSVDENGNAVNEDSPDFDTIYKNPSYRFYSSMNPSLTSADSDYIEAPSLDDLVEAGKLYKIVNFSYGNESYMKTGQRRDAFSNHTNDGAYAAQNNRLGVREEDGDYVTYYKLVENNLAWNQRIKYFDNLAYKDRNGKVTSYRDTTNTNLQSITFDEVNSTWTEQKLIDAGYPTTSNYSLFKYGSVAHMPGNAWYNGNPYVLQENGWKLKFQSYDFDGKVAFTYQGAIAFPEGDYDNYAYGTNWPKTVGESNQDDKIGAWSIENEEIVTANVAKKYFNVLPINRYNMIMVYMYSPGGWRWFNNPSHWPIEWLYTDYTPGFGSILTADVDGLPFNSCTSTWAKLPSINVEWDSNILTKPKWNDDNLITVPDTPFATEKPLYVKDENSDTGYSLLDMNSYTGNIFWYDVQSTTYIDNDAQLWYKHFKEDDLQVWFNTIGFSHTILKHKYIDGTFILEERPFQFKEMADGEVVYHPSHTMGKPSYHYEGKMFDWRYLEAHNNGHNFVTKPESTNVDYDYITYLDYVNGSQEISPVLEKFYGGDAESFIKHKIMSLGLFNFTSFLSVNEAANLGGDDVVGVGSPSAFTDGKLNIRIEAGKTVTGTIVPTTAEYNAAYSLNDPSSNYVGISKTSAHIPAGTVWEAKGGSLSELEALASNLYEYYKASIDSILMEDANGNLFISPELFNWLKTSSPASNKWVQWNALESGGKGGAETVEGGFYLNDSKGWAKIWSPNGGNNDNRDTLKFQIWNACFKNITFDETPAVNALGEDVLGTINVVLHPLTFESFQLGTLEKPWNAVMDVQVNNFNPTDLTFTVKYGKVTSEMVSNEYLSSHFYPQPFVLDNMAMVDLDGNSTRFVTPEAGEESLQSDGSGIGYVTTNTYPAWSSYTYNQNGSPSTNRFSANTNDSDGDGTSDDIDQFPLNPDESWDVDYDGIANNVDSDPYSPEAAYSIVQNVSTDEEIAVYGNMSLRGWSIGEGKVFQNSEGVRTGYVYLRNEAGNYDISGMTTLNLNYIKGGPDTVMFEFDSIFAGSHEFASEEHGGGSINLGNGFSSLSDKQETIDYLASYAGIGLIGTITFTAIDTYGDGWNAGATASPYVKIESMKADGSSNGVVYEELEAFKTPNFNSANKSVSINLEGNAEEHSFFRLEIGTGMYGMENKFQITFPDGQIIDGPSGPFYNVGGTTGNVSSINTGAIVSAMGNLQAYQTYFTLSLPEGVSHQGLSPNIDDFTS